MFAFFGSLLLLTQLMSLRQRLLKGGTAYGSLLLSDSPIITEVLANVGYDYLIVDHEHSPTDIRSGQEMLRSLSSTKTEPIVRLPCHDAVYMKKVLDSMPLPGGVLIPMVENAEMARQVVASTRYPRQFHDVENEDAIDEGIRGCAVPFVRASKFGGQKDYLRQCSEDLLVMVQVETPQAVEAIPEIAAVNGVDGIFLGPMDLSASIGYMGDMEKVQPLLQKAEEAVLESPAFLAGFRSRNPSNMFRDGYSLVCGSVDLGLLRDAAQRDVKTTNRGRKKE